MRFWTPYKSRSKWWKATEYEVYSNGVVAPARNNDSATDIKEYRPLELFNFLGQDDREYQRPGFLPPESLPHLELLNLDRSNNDAILQFVYDWGLLGLGFRYDQEIPPQGPNPTYGQTKILKLDLYDENIKKINDTTFATGHHYDSFSLEQTNESTFIGYRFESGTTFFHELFSLPPTEVTYSTTAKQLYYGEKFDVEDYEGSRRALDKLWPPSLRLGIKIFQEEVQKFSKDVYTQNSVQLKRLWRRRALRFRTIIDFDQNNVPHLNLVFSSLWDAAFLMAVQDISKNYLVVCPECGRYFRSEENRKYCAKEIPEDKLNHYDIMSDYRNKCAKAAHRRKTEQKERWNTFLESQEFDSALEKHLLGDGGKYKFAHPFDLIEYSDRDFNKLRFISNFKLRDDVPKQVIPLIQKWLKEYSPRKDYDMWIRPLQILIKKYSKDSG
ncbi:MAG: hypothetical protein K9N46_05370 [Candidatus Marinimicrobia bacterium]|nr:hypothetical protein [Candidatus Neomarinimicrobiota bacterium]MCF7880152.1 hypothetical protein [Candidatus Neomarinimicrobiota bacterium]